MFAPVGLGFSVPVLSRSVNASQCSSRGSVTDVLPVTKQVLLPSVSMVFICVTETAVIPAGRLGVMVESKRGTWHLVCGKCSINARSESFVEGRAASYRFA